MINKHTDGPWIARSADSVFDDNLVLNQCHAIDGKNWARLALVVTRITGDDVDDNQGLANSSLIAAAPDLLYAAKAALFVLNIVNSRDPGTNEAGAISDLSAAIAKAEGRS